MNQLNNTVQAERMTLITVNIGRMLEILIACIVSAAVSIWPCVMVSTHKLLNSCNVDSQTTVCENEDDQPSEEFKAAE